MKKKKWMMMAVMVLALTMMFGTTHQQPHLSCLKELWFTLMALNFFKKIHVLFYQV